MLQKQLTEILIEIEDLQKQLPIYKKTSTLLKEELKLYRKLRKLIHSKNKEIMANFEKKGRIPSSDSELKELVQPLKDAIEEYSEIIMEGTEQAIERGIRRTVNDLKKQGVKRAEKVKLPDSLLGLINSFSPVIAQYIKEHVFTASEKTMKRLIGNIMANLKESYEAGFGYNKAAQYLKEVFTGMETYELERVARTEIASKENLGMYMSEQELDVEYHQWKTARDNDVRDTHQDMEGEIVRVGEPFSNGMLYPGDFSSGADLSELINCFTEDTLISTTETERVYRRFYKGEIVTIKTASGNKLSGTPNHPILTSNGWIALNRLNNGDKVIRTSSDIFSGRKPNNNYIKTSFEEIYNLSSKLFPIKRSSTRTMDFHTDGRGSKEVNIVNMNSFLGNRLNAKIEQFIRQLFFIPTDILQIIFSNDSFFSAFFSSNFATPDSIVSFFSKSFSFGFRSVGHSNIHRFRPISERNIGFPEIPINNIPGNIKIGSQSFNRNTFLIKMYNLIRRQNNIIKFGIDRDIVISKSFPDNFISNTIFFSDGLNRVAVPVETDNIIDIKRSEFNGHVYNLQNKDNMYIANNIIAHNCRCTQMPFVMPEGYMAPAGQSYFREEDLVPISK